VRFVRRTRGAPVERRASSVDNSTNLVDEGSVVDVAIISEVTQFSLVVESPCIVARVKLDLLSVKEQTGHPFQVRVFCAVTDGVRALAEVDVREEGLSSFASSTGTSKVVQLTKVADTSCLDNTTAPPATSFDVSAGLLSKDWRSSVGAAFTIA